MAKNLRLFGVDFNPSLMQTDTQGSSTISSKSRADCYFRKDVLSRVF